MSALALIIKKYLVTNVTLTVIYNFQTDLFVNFYLIYRLLIFIEILARCKKHIMIQLI
jgi:hypothetical protein